MLKGKKNFCKHSESSAEYINVIFINKPVSPLKDNISQPQRTDQNRNGIDIFQTFLSLRNKWKNSENFTKISNFCRTECNSMQFSSPKDFI